MPAPDTLAAGEETAWPGDPAAAVASWRQACDDGPVTPRLLPPAVPATTMRVYEPLEAFAIADRPALEVLALREGADRRAEEAERTASWRGVLAGRGAVVPGPDGADATVQTGWTAAATGAGDDPGPGHPDGPHPDGGRADRAGPAGRPPTFLATRVLRAGGVVLVCPVGVDDTPGPGSVRPPRRLVRAWALPEAWLSLVRAEDGERAGGGGRYVVPMSTARSRAARALRTLRLGVGETELTAEVEIMARWLETFHPRAWVEVDAGPVVRLTGGEDGAEDVRMGLECLASGDPTGAAAAYHRLTTRQRLLDDLSRSS